MTFTEAMTRVGIAAAVAVSGISHAYLYMHGYRHIPTIGVAFLLQASGSFSAVRHGFGGPRRWLPAAHWSRSGCRTPSGFSGFPNADGSHHRTRRSAWSLSY
jgi:hypothetical protein